MSYTQILCTVYDLIVPTLKYRHLLCIGDLNVSEDKCAPETATTDESVIETDTIKAPVTHEELIVERRPTGESSTKVTKITEAPFESTMDMKVQISDDEIEVTKAPYTKEEVVRKKKPNT
jgi:uncharacterized protein (TIGR02271 family)